jgi:membrane-bound acyltransferase YfiQ involved in biofilm formation
LLWYAIFFVIGYMMGADKRFTVDVKKYGWICLVLWIVGFSGVGALVLALGYDPFSGGAYFSLLYVLYQISWSIMSWGAVVFVLNLGARYLNTNSKILAYGNEAVLPFYLFHQTIIQCVGWFVLRWDLGILPKLLIIAVVSFLLIMVLYEGLVRHFNVVRFIFGMRPKKKWVTAQPNDN